MGHSLQGPFYWALAIVVLVTGYVMMPVSHMIDTVRVEVHGIPTAENLGPVYLQKMDSSFRKPGFWQGRLLIMHSEKPSGMAFFGPIPEGAYRVVVPSKKCSTHSADIADSSHKTEAQTPAAIARFSFGTKHRWEEPHLAHITFDLEQCSTDLKFQTRSAWKWGF